MKRAKTFPASLVALIDRSTILGIRAGSEPHRIIGIWVVAVDGRVFVRSWGVKPGGWYRAWRDDPAGVMAVRGRARPIPVRAIPVRDERTKRAVSDAYAAKYNTPGSLKYVRDLARTKCRNATLELIPLRAARRTR
jgi:hypothetical protein